MRDPRQQHAAIRGGKSGAARRMTDPDYQWVSHS